MIFRILGEILGEALANKIEKKLGRSFFLGLLFLSGGIYLLVAGIIKSIYILVAFAALVSLFSCLLILLALTKTKK